MEYLNIKITQKDLIKLFRDNKKLKRKKDTLYFNNCKGVKKSNKD